MKFKPDERELKIINILKDNPGINREGIASILECSEATVKRTIQSMISKNMIRRIESNKSGQWIVNEDNTDTIT